MSLSCLSRARALSLSLLNPPLCVFSESASNREDAFHDIRELTNSTPVPLPVHTKTNRPDNLIVSIPGDHHPPLLTLTLTPTLILTLTLTLTLTPTLILTSVESFSRIILAMRGQGEKDTTELVRREYWPREAKMRQDKARQDKYKTSDRFQKYPTNPDPDRNPRPNLKLNHNLEYYHDHKP